MPVDHRMLLQQPPEMDLATPLNMYMNMKAERRAQNQQKYLERQQQRKMEVEDLASLTLNPQTGMPNPIAYPKALAGRGYIPELQAFNTQQRAIKKEGLEVNALERTEATEIDAMLGTGAKALLTLPKEQFAFGWEQFLGRAKDLGEDIPDNWYKPLTPENEQQIKGQLNYLAQRTGAEGLVEKGMYQAKVDEKGYWRNYNTATGQWDYAKDPETNKKIKAPDNIKYYESEGGVLPLSTKRPPMATPAPIPGVTPAGKKKREADVAKTYADVEIDKAEEARAKQKELDRRKKVTNEYKKLKLKHKSGIDKFARFVNKARKIANSPNLKYTTGWGRANVLKGKDVWGTVGADLQADIDNLVGMGAIQTMIQLKAESKQGATGFGALNAAELKIMQDALGSIQNDKISAKKKREIMNEVADVVDSYQDRMEQFEAKYADDLEELNEEPTGEMTEQDILEGL